MVLIMATLASVSSPLPSQAHPTPQVHPRTRLLCPFPLVMARQSVLSGAVSVPAACLTEG